MKKLLSSAVAIASVIGVCALPSQVSAGADGITDNTNRGNILGIAGSDTTTFVMDALSAGHNTNSRYNPDKDRAVNIPPLVSANPSVEAGEATTISATTPKDWLAAARSTWPGGIVLPADKDCKVNLVFGGYGSRDLNANGDTSDGVVGTPSTWEGATIAEADLSVPADGDTSDVGEKWYLGLVPPNGSSAGRNAMSGTVTNGMFYNGTSSPGGTAGSACIDIARSSSKSFNASREGWAFALDAIDWTYFGGNTHGVAQTGLTQDQLNKIYSCMSPSAATTAARDAGVPGVPDVVGDRVAGYPEYSLWGDVTGNSADTTPIVAYRVQAGSGTGEDVAKTLLKKDDNSDGKMLLNCRAGFTFPQVQEHDCRNVSDANKPHAICFYGYSRWVIQAKALETDKRNGAVFGKFKINGDLKRPSFSSINETASRFEGTRYVYNYVGLRATGSTVNDLPRIEDSRRFVGVSAQPAACLSNATGTAPNQVVSEVTANADCNFDGDKTDDGVAVGGVPGYICGDLTARKIIATYGLKPLPMAATNPADGALGQSYCRLNASANVPAF